MVYGLQKGVENFSEVEFNKAEINIDFDVFFNYTFNVASTLN